MTVYWAGGEECSFSSLSFQGGASGYYRPEFARGSIGTQDVSDGFPMTSFARTPKFGPVSEFWVHGQYGQVNGSEATASGAILVVAYDHTGVARLMVRGTGQPGQIKITTYDAAGAFVDLVTSAAGVMNFFLPNPLPCAFDFFINYASSGQATVYWNGINICDTGTNVDVTTDGATALVQVDYSAASASPGNASSWSECIIQDTSTIGYALQTLAPLAPGATQTWTGSVSNIDSVAVNYANYNYTTTPNDISEWTVSPSLPLGSWSIIAVAVGVAMSTGPSSLQHFAFDVNVTAGSFQQGDVPLTEGFNFYQLIWPSNPSTMGPWAAGDLLSTGVQALA